MSEHEVVSVNDVAKRLLEPWKPRERIVRSS